MKISDLTVYQSPLPKIRLGKDGDGGYIICDGLEYDCFLSWGIDNDISFEEDFLEKYPDLECHAYDGSINQLPLIQKSTSEWRIFFHKQFIGEDISETMSNLHTFFEENEHIMVKMDIEWGEFPWIDSLTDSQLQKIQQMVIEFHLPFIPEKWHVLERLARTHWLVHFHPNNCFVKKNNFVQWVYVPDIFECTYIHKKSIAQKWLMPSSEPIPGPLDQKNTKNPDIIISDYPFNRWCSERWFLRYVKGILFRWWIRQKSRIVRLSKIYIWPK